MFSELFHTKFCIDWKSQIAITFSSQWKNIEKYLFQNYLTDFMGIFMYKC